MFAPRSCASRLLCTAASVPVWPELTTSGKLPASLRISVSSVRRSSAGQRVAFARIPEQPDAVSAGLDQIMQQPNLAVEIQTAIVVECRIQNGEDA